MFVLAYSCPSRQRSVFVLSMAMLVFASRIFNIPGITARKNALVGKGLVNMNSTGIKFNMDIHKCQSAFCYYMYIDRWILT